jgi:sugar transferase (PEP-CTERM/EpsH1 system associated)
VKIVFLCQRVPWPPDRGDRITTWHFLDHLLRSGAEVRLGCFREEARDAEAVRFLAGRCREVEAPMLRRSLLRKLASLRGLLRGKALTLPFFFDQRLQRAVDRWLAADPPDLVYVYSSSMAQYVLGSRVPGRRVPGRRGPVKVMQFAELDSDKFGQYAAHGGPLARWLYGREARTLLRFEDAVARDFDRSFVVSEVERGLFTQRIPGVVPAMLPNGVDVDHFMSKGDGRREPRTLVFTGVMDYAPNVDGIVWFAEQCWPPLRARFPDSKLLIVGSRPVPAVQALAQRPGIEVTGRVPETPQWFDRATVAIAPLRLARGVQNKVLEAMSMALPVVAMPQAAQGLGELPPGTLRTAATAAETVDAIAELFLDPARARREGAAAAAWVRVHFRWEHMYARLDAELAALGLGPAAGHPAPPGNFVAN